MTYNKVIGAVEIGTSKVVALVGELVGDRSLNIIGQGEATTVGVKKGEIVDFRAASDCAHAALQAAERNARATVEAVYLSQTGGHLKGFYNRGVVSVSAPDSIVSKIDIERAVNEAKRKELPDGRVYIHHIHNGDHLDGRPVANPRMMQGDKLEVGYWHVHGDEQKVRDHIHVINGFGLEVEDMIISSIASGSMVASDVEKENGALVLDIGRGTTDYVLYRSGRILRTGVVCIGGDHITNDLSLGLRMAPDQAEKFKKKFGNARIDPVDKSESVWLFGDLTIGERAVPKLAIYKIIAARIEELFSILKRELGGDLNQDRVAGGVILTGGTSRLPGIAEAASSALGVEARLGNNPKWVLREDLRDPEYSCALGLLYYGLNSQRSGDVVQVKKGFVRRVARLLSID